MENYNEYRRSSRAVRVGREGTAALTVGGIAPVSVQTMLNVPTDDLGGMPFSSAAASDCGCADNSRDRSDSCKCGCILVSA